MKEVTFKKYNIQAASLMEPLQTTPLGSGIQKRYMKPCKTKTMKSR
ncbi:hypothetical protein KAI37_03658 [Paenibacillus sp. S25]|nr:hypothetical protein KAI37_03658 [Paenibacillus sp. S25]